VLLGVLILDEYTPDGGHMPEEIDVTPRSRRKGLLAFYIGIGVASLLVVGACFAWKPLRVRERQVTPEQPQAKRHSLLGFYVGAGFLALLFAVFYFVWAPLRIWYWERQVLANAPTGELVLEGDPPLASPCTTAARKLADVGPGSAGALRRLLGDESVHLQFEIVAALRRSQDAWALPILGDVIADPDSNYWVVVVAARNAGRITGQEFLEEDPEQPKQDLATPARKRFQEWWEREGKARYGRGK
jgi:hypothetical protein